MANEATEHQRDLEILRTSHRALQIANQYTEMQPVLEGFTATIKEFSGCSALGIRILEPDGQIPYQAWEGFSAEFFALENALSIHRDRCVCIAVTRGESDPTLPCFTEGGSFVTGSTTRLLGGLSPEERSNFRGNCQRFGYETVAVIPIRIGQRILGAVHIADPREDALPRDKVEALEKIALQLGTAIQRVWTEEALRESEARFRTVAETLPNIVWTAREDGAVDYYNRRWYEYTGIPQKDGEGWGWSVILHPEDEAMTTGAWRQAVQTGQAYQVEHRLRGADGEYRWFLSRGRPLRNEAGRITHWFGTATDIHERKMAEELLEHRVAARTAELRQANEALAQYTLQLQTLTAELTVAEQRERRRLAQVLHDHLQQLLVATSLHVQVLQRHARQTAFAEPLAEVNALLDESIEASRSLTVELSPPVLYEQGLAAALRWLARWMADKHSLTVEVEAASVADDLPETTRVLLFQAVRELLFNVVKHAQVDRACVRLSSADGRLWITITDEGAGFDPAAKPAGGGGLGLFSIRERLKLLGGELTIDSRPGMGTCATLVIMPATPETTSTT